jgi:hypothetical protein
MIYAMTIFLFLAFVALVVVALEHHDRRTRTLPHAPHGSDSSIDLTGLDHDFDRVWHDATARA